MAALLAVWLMPKFWSGTRPAGVPFGIVFIPGTENFGTQDFALHLSYLQQIWHQSVAHPYRLDDQEQMVKLWFPRMASGLPHAYSPVTLVMTLPLLGMTPGWAYFLVTLLNAVLLVLLTAFYLLPRVKNSVQAGALLAAFCGYVLFDIFLMGQTAIITTSLLAASMVLLKKRSTDKGRWNLSGEILLGLLLYFMAIKPSVALILAALLAGERAWKPLIIAGFGFVLTWLLLVGHYGGVVSGLRDYLWILNHYCQADMTPFMRPGLVPGISTNLTSCLTILFPAQNAHIFLASRWLFEGLTLILLLARLMGRINLSTQFQGLLWTFLLFCPHLLVTEDFVICLLIGEGSFFRPDRYAALKILLVFLLVNLVMGTWTTWPLFFVVKLILAGWWLMDLISTSSKTPDNSLAADQEL